jgi:integrase
MEATKPVFKLHKEPSPKKKRPQNIFELIDHWNTEEKITIQYKKVKSNKYILFLRYWNPMKKKLEYDHPKVFILGDRNNFQRDKQVVEKVKIRRDMKWKMIIDDEATSLNPDQIKRSKINLKDYFQQVMDKKYEAKMIGDNSYQIYTNTLLHVKQHYIGDYDLNSLEVSDFNDFYFFIRGVEKPDGTKRLSNNTAHDYFRTLKSIITYAVETDEIIEYNKAKKVKVAPLEEIETIYLTEEEVQKLIETPIMPRYEELKSAFIFSCVCGLRFSDIIKIEFEKVEEGVIFKRQQKTKKSWRLKLHPIALEILEEQKALHGNEGKIFDIDKFSRMTISDNIKRWAKDAGIKKNVTL